MLKKVTVYLQYLLPQHVLTHLLGLLANCQQPWLKNTFIYWFQQRYQIQLNEAISQDYRAYPTFNAFFTRQLQPHLRPIAPSANSITSPADGTISQIGPIHQQSLIQAKGFDFSLSTLLAGDKEACAPFVNGQFTTIYLSPRDYHRVHMPIAGTLIKSIFIPGRLFSVNAATAATIPNLYARNERLVCLFETAMGKVAVIFVGAMIVGSIKPAWLPQPIKSTTIAQEIHSPPKPFQKGEELGLFQLGSTVILLFEAEKIDWHPLLAANSSLKFGQEIAAIRSA